jgi:hypothetical protein
MAGDTAGARADTASASGQSRCHRVGQPDRARPGPAIEDRAVEVLNGLRLLRDRLGGRFVGGFVLNLGELVYCKESKIAVIPLSALWSLLGRSFS